jgi:DNA-binding NarL/FixJ family response regulator
MVSVTQATERGVLLVAEEGPTGLSLVRALETATINVEWAKTAAALRARAARHDLRGPEVVFLDLDLELAGARVDDVVSLVRASFPQAAVVALAVDLSGEGAARLLCQGVPSLNKPVSPGALAGLAVRLASQARAPGGWRPNDAPPPGRERGAHLEAILSSYALDRVLSKQQQLIFRLYLGGQNDKEIARVCACSEATVYEHWRRMARKAGGSQKADVIADFHRFLGDYLMLRPS